MASLSTGRSQIQNQPNVTSTILIHHIHNSESSTTSTHQVPHLHSTNTTSIFVQYNIHKIHFYYLTTDIYKRSSKFNRIVNLPFVWRFAASTSSNAVNVTVPSFQRTAASPPFTVENLPPGEVDLFPPATVTDLDFEIASFEGRTVMLKFTAQGDDLDSGTGEFVCRVRVTVLDKLE